MKRQGFSLIEVVVAVALFASAAVVLSSAFVNALLARDFGKRNASFAEDVRTVRLQLLLEPDLENAEDGGLYETFGAGEAEWEAVIEPMEVVDLFYVRLRITFSEPPEGVDPLYLEELYLLRPTWSVSEERSDLLADKRDALHDGRGFE